MVIIKKVEAIVLSVFTVAALLFGEEAEDTLLKYSGTYHVSTITHTDSISGTCEKTYEYFESDNGITYVKDSSSGEWAER